MMLELNYKDRKQVMDLNEFAKKSTCTPGKRSLV